MSEYESLRQEILGNINAIVQYNNLLYSVTALILAFAVDKGNPFLFLIPYAVIIPIYLLAEEQRRTNANIAAYMIVFLEGTDTETDHHWETRLHSRASFYKPQNPIQRKFNQMNVPARTPYLLLSSVCSLCAFWQVPNKSDMTNSSKLTILFIALVTVITWVLMIRNTKGNTETKERYIKKWQAIKAAEDAQKRKNTRNPQ